LLLQPNFPKLVAPQFQKFGKSPRAPSLLKDESVQPLYSPSPS
jgi:hypothetical protein